MSDQPENRPINPEAVAAKFAAVANFEQEALTSEMIAEPRLREIPLFLQYVSQPENYAGGLRKFAAELVAQSGDLLGTLEMRACGEAGFTSERAREIFSGMPSRTKGALGEIEEDWGSILGGSSLEEFPWEATARRERDKQAERSRLEHNEQILATLTWRKFHQVCAERAKEELATYLRELCELPHVRFHRQAAKEHEGWAAAPGAAPWYFCDVAAAILRFIDRRKTEIAGTIAETEITRTVFKWLGKARNTSRAVLLSGNSRFGKTEALRTWCAMSPGTARLVNTPASNSEGDLLREVAKALGLEIRPSCRGSQLRDRIDYVLRHTRLMLVFDEAHLIFPVNVSRNTAPARLNWVRRSVMDAGLPCAFCCTPQSYGSAKRRFVRTTGYAIEQFDGRLLKTVELPAELSREDLLAAARIHFAALREDFLQFVVSKTFVAERNYMSDLEKIAALARDNAEEAGRVLPTLEDIKAALADVLPPENRPPAPISPATRETTLPTRCTSRAKPAQINLPTARTPLFEEAEKV